MSKITRFKVTNSISTQMETNFIFNIILTLFFLSFINLMHSRINQPRYATRMEGLKYPLQKIIDFRFGDQCKQTTHELS